MELKHVYLLFMLTNTKRFNRTFMELKQPQKRQT